MRTVPKFAIVAFSAAAIAGTAFAATRNNHVLNVQLPDGAVAHVEYSGNVTPKVTIDPGAAADMGLTPMPSFAGFDRMIAQMNRESEDMMRQAQQLSRQSAKGGAMPYVASFGNAPAGMTSTTIISYSNGSGTCTRSTETVWQGTGKAPIEKSSLSGHCGASAAPARPVSSAPISRT